MNPSYLWPADQKGLLTVRRPEGITYGQEARTDSAKYGRPEDDGSLLGLPARAYTSPILLITGPSMFRRATQDP